MQLPEEFCEPGEFGNVCGRLKCSLYCTRDAASNWEACYAELLISIGFKQGVYSPCVFHHPVKDISTVVHGDDFASLACESNLLWLRDQFQTRFLIKDRGLLGPESHDVEYIRL